MQLSIKQAWVNKAMGSASIEFGKCTGRAHIIVPDLIIVPVDRMGPGGPI